MCSLHFISLPSIQYMRTHLKLKDELISVDWDHTSSSIGSYCNINFNATSNRIKTNPMPSIQFSSIDVRSGQVTSLCFLQYIRMDPTNLRLVWYWLNELIIQQDVGSIPCPIVPQNQFSSVQWISYHFASLFNAMQCDAYEWLGWEGIQQSNNPTNNSRWSKWN